MTIKRLLIILIPLICGSKVFSQAHLRGVVRDSLLHENLPSATVALYRVSDSTLISYQLSTETGAFDFPEVPVGKPLLMKVFYTGYQRMQQRLTLRGDTNLRTISLVRNDKQLKEVEVKGAVPVRMNGDTLEFNADAFTMEASAVGEDLLKKLPGVVLWPDGSITVNGRKVNNVLVNGKPFFGGGTKVATQNIPKNAIDKIQVFQKKQLGVVNPDSATAVNIRLKEDKDVGYFGKVSAGGGTGGRYEGGLGMNAFTPGNQLGLGGATNNVNKMGASMESLQEENTFKPIGLILGAMPDFQAQGIHASRYGALTFQHDFRPGNDMRRSDVLEANVSLTGTQTHKRSSTHSTLFLGDDSTQVKDDSNTGDEKQRDANVGLSYRHRTQELAVTTVFNAGKNHSESSSHSLTTTNAASNAEVDNTTTDGHNASMQLELQHSPPFTGHKARLPSTWSISYTYNNSDDNSQVHRLTNFVAPGTPSQNQSYDQLKQLGERRGHHALDASLGDLARWMRLPQTTNISLGNKLEGGTQRTDNQVDNLDSISHKYVENTYLSIRETNHVWNEMPSLQIGQSFLQRRSLCSNSFFGLRINAGAQWYVLQNISNHAERNITQRYQNVVPSATLGYNITVNGRFQKSYSVSYNSSYQYPTLDQLAPLADSTDPFSLHRGNLSLQPTRMHDLGLAMHHMSLNPKISASYDLKLGISMQDHMLVDSTQIDSLGRNVHYTVNAGGTRSYFLGGVLNQSFSGKHARLQIMLTPSVSLSYTPVLVNNTAAQAPVWTARNMFSLGYTINDKYILLVNNNITYNRSNSVAAFHSLRNLLGMLASIQCTDRLLAGTSVDYSHSKSSGANGIDYTIWNMNASYRFLKGKTLEVKVVAMDLLRQNKGVSNSATPVAVVQSVGNSLQQYFMLTVAYFPRKFGR